MNYNELFNEHMAFVGYAPLSSLTLNKRNSCYITVSFIDGMRLFEYHQTPTKEMSAV